MALRGQEKLAWCHPANCVLGSEPCAFCHPLEKKLWGWPSGYNAEGVASAKARAKLYWGWRDSVINFKRLWDDVEGELVGSAVVLNTLREQR